MYEVANVLAYGYPMLMKFLTIRGEGSIVNMVVHRLVEIKPQKGTDVVGHAGSSTKWGTIDIWRIANVEHEANVGEEKEPAVCRGTSAV